MFVLSSSLARRDRCDEPCAETECPALVDGVGESGLEHGVPDTTFMIRYWEIGRGGCLRLDRKLSEHRELQAGVKINLPGEPKEQTIPFGAATRPRGVAIVGALGRSCFAVEYSRCRCCQPQLRTRILLAGAGGSATAGSDAVTPTAAPQAAERSKPQKRDVDV